MIGAEEVALGLGLELGPEGHRMGRHDRDVDPRAGSRHEVLDRPRLAPVDGVRSPRQRLAVEPEADAGGTGRDPAGVEQEDPQRQLITVERPVASPRGDHGRRLDRERRLADAAGE